MVRLMNPFDAIEKLITEHGAATILRERITQAKEQQVALEKENTSLKSERDVLKTQNARLAADLHEARSEIERAKPLGFVESMGVLWKRTSTGFEPNPYCRECPSHPIMLRPEGFDYWFCGNSKHTAPLTVKPPA